MNISDSLEGIVKLATDLKEIEDELDGYEHKLARIHSELSQVLDEVSDPEIEDEEEESD